MFDIRTQMRWISALARSRFATFYDATLTIRRQSPLRERQATAGSMRDESAYHGNRDHTAAHTAISCAYYQVLHKLSYLQSRGNELAGSRLERVVACAIGQRPDRRE
jgi:hypothetical protein